MADGEFALQSGDVSDQQASSIKVQAAFSGGTGSFSSRVDSEESWDKLVFLIDGRVIQEWSGLVDWNEYEFKLTSGTHELEWRYQKDFANSRGADAAWLDNVNLPLSLGGTIGLISVGDQHRIRVWGRSVLYIIHTLRCRPLLPCSSLAAASKEKKKAVVLV